MIAARCSCGGQWDRLAFLIAPEKTVDQMVRHWEVGHDVACLNDVRPIVAQTATKLAAIRAARVSR